MQTSDLLSRIGFHLPPLVFVGHLHLHIIAPASQMGFLSRLAYRDNSYWYHTVSVIRIGKICIQLNCTLTTLWALIGGGGVKFTKTQGNVLAESSQFEQPSRHANYMGSTLISQGTFVVEYS